MLEDITLYEFNSLANLKKQNAYGNMECMYLRDLMIGLDIFYTR